jgi:hypothetical protein
MIWKKTELLLALSMAPTLFLGSACNSSSGDDIGLIAQDAHNVCTSVNGCQDAAAGADAGPGNDANVNPDAAVGLDAVNSIDATPQDASTPDTGMQLQEELAPGSHVTIPAAQLNLTDTFADIKSKIGMGTRNSAMGTRVYEWNITGFHLAIWFANTMVSSDAFPNDIHDGDKVLWIAVDGMFTGKTSKNIGVGSTRASVEASSGGYGAPPHTLPLNGTQTLAQYYTTGFLALYDQTNTLTTFTVCKAYGHEPNGTIDPANVSLTFDRGQIQVTRGIGQFGTALSQITALLGAPDGDGMIMAGTNQLRLVDWGFIGIEVGFLSIDDHAIFTSVHAPYYGTLMGGTGIGSSRADLETALGLGPGTMSPTTANLHCYTNASGGVVGVSYSTDPVPVTTSISFFPQCP